MSLETKLDEILSQTKSWIVAFNEISKAEDIFFGDILDECLNELLRAHNINMEAITKATNELVLNESLYTSYNIYDKFEEFSRKELTETERVYIIPSAFKTVLDYLAKEYKYRIRTRLSRLTENIYYSLNVTKQQQRIFNVRVNTLLNSLQNRINFIEQSILEQVSVETKQIVDLVFSIQEKKDEEEIRKIFLNTVENIKKEKLEKIFDYKEMESLDKDKGFEFSRQTGSHRMYTHNKTNKVVVIPAHKLKYGLMCAIQKQIQEGCK